MSRLIDADKLVEEIRSYRMTVTGLRAGKGVLNECMRHFSEGILKIIDEQPTVNDWIPCSERMPEERDSIFKKFKGTDKWRNAMFEKMSDNVNVTVVKCTVIAWQPLPESYNPERSDT